MTNAALSPKTAEAIARLGSLLGHPLRVRLMDALATNGPGSATTFSEQFGDASVGDCHYHLTALKNGGVIELVRSRKVRGATERIYRLRPRSRWHGARQFQHLVDGLLPVASLERNTTAITVPLVVDDHGFAQATGTIEEAAAAVGKIAAESDERLREHPEMAISAVVQVAAFETSERGGG